MSLVSLLAVMAVAQTPRVVIADIANVRRAADEKAPIAARLRINTTVPTFETSNGWVRVQQSAGVNGFVRAELLGDKPVDSNEALAVAIKFREAGNWANALTWASRAYAADPQSAEAFGEFEQALTKSGKTKEAKELRAEFEGRAPVYLAICGREGVQVDGPMRAEVLAIYDRGKGLRKVNGEAEDARRAVSVAPWYAMPQKKEARVAPQSLFPAPQVDPTFDGAGGPSGAKLTASCDQPGLFATSPLAELPPPTRANWESVYRLAGLQSKDPFAVSVSSHNVGRGGLTEAKLTFRVEVPNEPSRSTEIARWFLFKDPEKPLVSAGDLTLNGGAIDVRDVKWARLPRVDDVYIAVLHLQLHPFEDGKALGSSALIVAVDSAGKISTLKVDLDGGGC